MSLFHGTARKVALLPIIFLFPGWIVYVVGFVMLVVVLSDADKPLTGPVYYDIYATLVGGPILGLSSVLHAGLPGIASSIVGALAAAVSVFYFVSAGSVLLKAGERVYNTTSEFSERENSTAAYECMFAGILLLALCWTFILMLSTCYNSGPTRSYEESIRYYSGDETERLHKSWFVGIARKMAIPFVILSAVGWAVFLYGVHKMPATHSFPFPYDLGYWGAILPALLLYLTALLHAGCSDSASTMMGIVTSILSMLYLVCLGQVIHQVGTDIICRGEAMDACPTQQLAIPAWRIWQFSGGLAACLFWACVLVLWPFYERSNSVNRHSVEQVNVGGTGRGNDYESMSLLSTQRV